MRISDWSSDVCSSDLGSDESGARSQHGGAANHVAAVQLVDVTEIHAASPVLPMLRGVLGKFRVMARRQGRWPDLVRRRPGPNKWQADSVAAAAFHRVPRKLPDRKSTRLNSSH